MIRWVVLGVAAGLGAFVLVVLGAFLVLHSAHIF